MHFCHKILFFVFVSFPLFLCSAKKLDAKRYGKLLAFNTATAPKITKLVDKEQLPKDLGKIIVEGIVAGVSESYKYAGSPETKTWKLFTDNISTFSNAYFSRIKLAINEVENLDSSKQVVNDKQPKDLLPYGEKDRFLSNLLFLDKTTKTLEECKGASFFYTLTVPVELTSRYIRTTPNWRKKVVPFEDATCTIESLSSNCYEVSIDDKYRREYSVLFFKEKGAIVLPAKQGHFVDKLVFHLPCKPSKIAIIQHTKVSQFTGVTPILSFDGETFYDLKDNFTSKHKSLLDKKKSGGKLPHIDSYLHDGVIYSPYILNAKQLKGVVKFKLENKQGTVLKIESTPALYATNAVRVGSPKLNKGIAVKANSIGSTTAAGREFLLVDADGVNLINKASGISSIGYNSDQVLSVFKRSGSEKSSIPNEFSNPAIKLKLSKLSFENSAVVVELNGDGANLNRYFYPQMGTNRFEFTAFGNISLFAFDKNMKLLSPLCCELVKEKKNQLQKLYFWGEKPHYVVLLRFRRDSEEIPFSTVLRKSRFK